MIKLSLAKKFGIKLAAGDVFEGVYINQGCLEFLDKDITYGDGVIESFTPRLISDGIPTSIDGDVLLEITNGNGLVIYISARNVAWNSWTTWRPSMEWLVQQSSDKPAVYKDDTQQFGEDVIKSSSDSDAIGDGFISRCLLITPSDKPTFTQAMADAGELPPVGSEFSPNSSEKCIHICLGYTSIGKVVGEGVNDGCVSLFFANEIKPLDTRTEKQKEVDLALAEWPMADKPTLEFAYDYWLSGRKQ